MKTEIICGLDIGTSKICASVGSVTENGELHLVSLTQVPAHGIDKGKVLELESVTHAVEVTLDNLQKESNLKIDSLVLGVSSDVIKGWTNRRTHVLSERGKEISRSDIEKLVEAAKELSSPLDYEIIHAFIKEFSVDRQRGIKEPLGMFGSKLSVQLHVISVPSNILYNLKKCVYNAGYDIETIVVSGVASSELLLNSEDKETGVIFLEIGAGTTQAFKFKDGVLVWSFFLPFGGRDIDQIISRIAGVSLAEAEEIKLRFCNLISEKERDRDILSSGGRKIPQKRLKQVVRPSVEKVLFKIKRCLEREAQLKDSPAGIVLNGGFFLMDGVTEKIQEIFRVPVRIGVPRQIKFSLRENIPLTFHTSLGLICYADRLRKKYLNNFLPSQKGNLFSKAVSCLKKIYQEYF